VTLRGAKDRRQCDRCTPWPAARTLILLTALGVVFPDAQHGGECDDFALAHVPRIKQPGDDRGQILNGIDTIAPQARGYFARRGIERGQSVGASSARTSACRYEPP
jgi:hypothetical protein